MNPMEFEEDYNLEANFDKSQIMQYVEEVRRIIAMGGIPNALWSLHPYRFRLHLQSNDPQTELLYTIYKLPGVKDVSLSIEPNSRIILLVVALERGWFENQEIFNAGKRRTGHPEDRDL